MFDEARWLTLDRHAGETLRAALERTLRDEILSGALRAGVRLPASRTFALQLGVSRGVVTDAYGQLEAQGFLVSRAREAPMVAEVQGPVAVRSEPEVSAPLPRRDLSPTSPDVTLFPLTRWLAAAQHVARRGGTAILDYREPRGESVLREVLADHLGRTRGVIADPAQIVIVQGTSQGVDLLLRLLRARGVSRVAVEDPSHTTQQQRIRAMGLEVVPQPVDTHGLVVDGLEAGAVVVTPAHQFPTGSVLSGARRRDLIAWSSANGAVIIEDDYDSEFRYDREPVRALQGLAPEQVALLGTVSKTLAPALRLGWLVVPAHLVDEAVSTKRLLDDFSPALDQLTLAELLIRGHYDRHVRHARGVYRARRDRLLGALAKHLPGLRVEGVAAGVHLLLGLPPGVDDSAVARAAASAGIRVPALSAFRIRPAGTGGLVIGYGRVHESAVEPATEALARAIRRYL
jgi:GntR family transcriptional regulator / MocR family aminotransferase